MPTDDWYDCRGLPGQAFVALFEPPRLTLSRHCSRLGRVGETADVMYRGKDTKPQATLRLVVQLVSAASPVARSDPVAATRRLVVELKRLV